MAKGDHAAMEEARAKLKEDYRYFGYGYLDSPEEAVPPVAMTFYSFHIMVMAGGYLLLFFIIAVFSSLKGSRLWEKRWWQWVAILTIPWSGYAPKPDGSLPKSAVSRGSSKD